jgi:hypothetical protein
MHAAGSMVAIGVSEVLLSDGRKILRGIFCVRPTFVGRL